MLFGSAKLVSRSIRLCVYIEITIIEQWFAFVRVLIFLMTFRKWIVSGIDKTNLLLVVAWPARRSCGPCSCDLSRFSSMELKDILSYSFVSFFCLFYRKFIKNCFLCLAISGGLVYLDSEFGIQIFDNDLPVYLTFLLWLRIFSLHYYTVIILWFH